MADSPRITVDGDLSDSAIAAIARLLLSIGDPAASDERPSDLKSPRQREEAPEKLQ